MGLSINTNFVVNVRENKVKQMFNAVNYGSFGTRKRRSICSWFVQRWKSQWRQCWIKYWNWASQEGIAGRWSPFLCPWNEDVYSQWWRWYDGNNGLLFVTRPEDMLHQRQTGWNHPRRWRDCLVRRRRQPLWMKRFSSMRLMNSY